MKLKWETVDEEGLEGCGWSYRRTTHVTNVPGGILVRTSRVDTRDDNVTTSSVALCFVPNVSARLLNDGEFDLVELTPDGRPKTDKS